MRSRKQSFCRASSQFLHLACSTRSSNISGILENCPIPGDLHGQLSFEQTYESLLNLYGSLSVAAHRIPVHWLFHASYTRSTYPSTRDNKSSRSIQAATKNAFFHFNLYHIRPCRYKTLPTTNFWHDHVLAAGSEIQQDPVRQRQIALIEIE